jgi:DNA mismatch repair protein MutL
MTKIRILPPTTVNRIAAGEVVERPASVVKELIENALDAGATQIDVAIEAGGKRLLRIRDNGCGMTKEELQLAIMRHATSKLPDDDLLAIGWYGFRGEALPSIASMSRMRITSRAQGASDAWEISVEGGEESVPQPAAYNQGTQIEVRDMFYATPARLKFMKGDQAETQAINDIVQRLAMANPHVGFSVMNEGAIKLNYAPESGDEIIARLQRLSRVLGKQFGENAIALDTMREGVRLYGFAGLPTYHRATSAQQYLFVNGRTVRDKLLLGTVRAAYQDFLARDRHPALVLFLDVPSQEVDVNVHPAKSEVRFRDNQMVRGLIIGSLRHALNESGHRASSSVSHGTMQVLHAALSNQQIGNEQAYYPPQQMMESLAPAYKAYASQAQSQLWHAESYAPSVRASESHVTAIPLQQPKAQTQEFPLGAACAQVHETYIISQTKDGIVITDQHAAHERLVYERMKVEMAAQGGVKRQALLIPEVIQLEEHLAQQLLSKEAELAELGLVIEGFGGGAIVVREIPVLLGKTDIAGLVRDLADEIAEFEQPLSLKEKIAEICGNHACRNSVRAGRSLSIEEMNALLRQMEATPHSGQCNHGRPTYVELKLNDIERLFGRK